MAETNYRSTLSNFTWGSRGIALPTDSPQPTSSIPPSNNPFSQFTSSISGYIPLRSGSRTNEEEAYFALSRWERFSGFLLCTLGAAACFLISFFIGLPLLALKPRKFAVSFSLGSVSLLPLWLGLTFCWELRELTLLL